MADVQKIRMVLTSQHICGDEPLEGFDLELDRVGEGGGGEEQRGGQLHGGDMRHCLKHRGFNNFFFILFLLCH